MNHFDNLQHSFVDASKENIQFEWGQITMDVSKGWLRLQLGQGYEGTIQFEISEQQAQDVIYAKDDFADFGRMISYLKDIVATRAQKVEFFYESDQVYAFTMIHSAAIREFLSVLTPETTFDELEEYLTIACDLPGWDIEKDGFLYDIDFVWGGNLSFYENKEPDSDGIDETVSLDIVLGNDTTVGLSLTIRDEEYRYLVARVSPNTTFEDMFREIVILKHGKVGFTIYDSEEYREMPVSLSEEDFDAFTTMLNPTISYEEATLALPVSEGKDLT